jgi:hypothetical protein
VEFIFPVDVNMEDEYPPVSSAEVSAQEEDSMNDPDANLEGMDVDDEFMLDVGVSVMLMGASQLEMALVYAATLIYAVKRRRMLPGGI